jgi:hypothetical protein
VSLSKYEENVKTMMETSSLNLWFLKALCVYGFAQEWKSLWNGEAGNGYLLVC